MGTSYYDLKINNRSLTKTRGAKALRREGIVPGVLYFKGEPTENIEISKIVINKAINSGQRIFEVQLDGEKQYSMIKEIQFHPVTDEIIHIDLMRVRRSEKITIVIPLILTGESIGVKEGGVLTQSLNQVEIQCFPTDVPEQIELDISNLEINNSFSVSDLIAPSDEIVITSPSEINIVSIHMPVEEEVIEEEDEMALDSDEQSEEAEGSSEQSDQSNEKEDDSN
tara:strand:+ start:1153 stop:1827 length:675 start_codon:yes stop_codon:yes gene_type:complete